MMKIVTISLISLFLIGAPVLVSAQTVNIKNPFAFDSFQELIMNLIEFLIYLSIIGAVFAIIYGGFTYITAGGDPQKIQKANQIITYAIVGLILAVSSYAIVKFFLSTVLELDVDL